MKINTKNKYFKLSWFSFTLCATLFLSAMNFNLFGFIYQSIDKDSTLWQHIAFVPMVFFLLFGILSAILVPYLTKPFIIIFIMVACVSAYFMNAYGVIIDKDMIENALQTDIKEVNELLNVKFAIFILLLGVLPSILVWKIQIIYAPHGIKKALFLRVLCILISIILLLGIFIPQMRFFVPFFRHYYQSEFYTTPFYQLKSLVKYIKAHTFIKPPLEIIATDSTKGIGEKNLLILVLGETARAANFSLFEGTRLTDNDTNAYTKPLGVEFFNDVSSCGTSTAVSLPCMFSISKREEYKNKEYKQNALDILLQVGVNVAWLGNNSGGCQGVCERIESVKMLNEDYDGALLPHLQDMLKNIKGDSIFIIHLQGSHGPTYYKRYPADFRYFTPTCDTNELQQCTKEELRNTYDNSIIYTDYILSKIIEMLYQHKDYRASLLYVSDHGESLGENGIYLHAMPYFIAPKEQKHVPMLFWSNDKTLMDIAYKHKNYHLSHDYIFSTLLGYFNVQTKVYQKELDIFHAIKEE